VDLTLSPLMASIRATRPRAARGADRDRQRYNGADSAGHGDDQGRGVMLGCGPGQDHDCALT
jgi:hypothetical protein